MACLKTIGAEGLGTVDLIQIGNGFSDRDPFLLLCRIVWGGKGPQLGLL
jgi:hypothetical protein